MTRSLPLDHLFGVLAFDVGDRNEVRQQLAAVIGDGEIALVPGQRRDHNLTRQFKILLVKRADDRHGPLNQRGNLVVQRLAVNDSAADPFGRGIDAVANHLAAALEVGDDVALFLETSR